MIPFDEAHLRQFLKSRTLHYTQRRPHSGLGPGMPDRASIKSQIQSERHAIPKDCRIVVT
jgi:hypothetical protein